MPHREVRFGAYTLGATLGEGEFGKVKLGWRKDGQQLNQVAIKLIKRASIVKDSESEIKVHREINSLKLLNHPNIVHLLEVMKSAKYIGIVLEYASGGELFDYILTNKCLKENEAKKLFAQLVSGVDYMHAKGLVHRDLKLENLLLDKHKNVIISDFGFVNSYSRDRGDMMKTSCGSPCYAAPELVLSQAPYEGKKVDIWSLGVILYAMLAGYLPFDDDPENEDGSDIMRLYHYICRTPLTFPEYILPLPRDLLRRIIVPDPRKRQAMSGVMSHPWLASYSNLLSIRQPEWDIIYKQKSDARMIDGNAMRDKATSSRAGTGILNSASKRFSMINESSYSTGFILAPNSGNIVAPRNSIIASSGSTNTIPEINSGARGYNNISNIKESPSRSPSHTKRVPYATTFQTSGNSKAASISQTNSSASNALKAVATEHDNRRNSLTSLESVTTNHMGPQATNKAVSNSYATNTRASAFNNGTISTIIESPKKSENKETPVSPGSANNGLVDHNSNQLNDAASSKSVQASNTQTTASSLGQQLPTKSNTPVSRESTRMLPHSNKKPRPTSYHPSSLSSSLFPGNVGTITTSSLLLDHNEPQIPLRSGGQVRSSLFASKQQPTSQVDTASLASNSSSPIKATGLSMNSRRNSVVTHINVNGVLSNDSSSSTNKRNSVLSYLEDRMEALDLTEHNKMKAQRSDALEQESRRLEGTVVANEHDYPKMNHISDNQSKTLDNEDSNTDDNDYATSKIELGQNKVQSVHPGNNDRKVDEDPQKSEEASERVVSRESKSSSADEQQKHDLELRSTQKVFEKNTLNQGKNKQTESYPSKSTKTSGTIRSNSTKSRKAHGDNHSQASKESKDHGKRNRFSLFMFYNNGYNSPSSSKSSNSNTASTGTHHSSNKKILEQSSETNRIVTPSVREQKRIDSNSSYKSASQNRNSTAFESPSAGKEASAAKKVMDFFKRRSVRIG